MVAWLLGNDLLEPYRQELLTATATGEFFKMYIIILLLLFPISYSCFCIEENHLIMVNIHWDLLVVLVNGILSKSYLNMVLILIQSVEHLSFFN